MNERNVFRKTLMIAAVSLFFLGIHSCSKEVVSDKSEEQLGLTHKAGTGNGEYGPMICSTPAEYPGGDTGCGAMCGLTNHGGCYEETPCYGERTMDDGPATLVSGSFADVYSYLLSIGEIEPMGEGDIILDQRLLDAMKRDGHPIID